ncbi:FlgO family outer membrane protein [Glaciecola siphonariae]|uniref:FlgO family outer membrane protein n=1 Tax=Glaciecola siphonariae TaxID=521012 RepID=A0ABV9LUQ2_9ALTE
MKLFSTLLGCLVIAGCSSIPGMHHISGKTPEPEQNAQLSSAIVDVPAQANQPLPNANNGGIDAFGSMEKPVMIGSTPGAFKSLPLTRHVGHYVRNMAQDLVGNMEYVTERTPVAITHFSLIDSDLRETNLLGQQMAESFVHEFHKFRMPVVEFKATQFIRVTETGDYVLSRDFLDLNNSTPIQYVLTGTMTKHQGGFIVNARMLGMESKVVVASAQSFIPFYVVEALLPSESSRQNEIVDGVRIIQGE